MARSFITAAVALGLVAGMPAAAFAGSPDTRSTEVSFTDLDLGSEQGVMQLDRRIRRAAAQVCGRTSGRMPIADMQRASSCQKVAVAGTTDAVQLAVAAARGGADYAANAVTVRNPVRAAD